MAQGDRGLHVRTRLSWAVGLAIGAMLGAACMALAISSTASKPSRLPQFRPARVRGVAGVSGAAGAAASVRSFLTLEHATLLVPMTRFVTARARKEWFDPATWGGIGSLKTFTVLGSKPVSGVTGPPEYEVSVDQRYTTASGDVARRRIAYRVVEEGGVWLIDDYSVTSAAP